MCTVLLLTVQMSLFTSCNDDLAADSYYTFTGEMMSDFLKNREDFSLFKRIVERAGEMDFLSSRGLPDFLSGRQFRSGIIFERTWLRFGRGSSGRIVRYVGESLFGG